MENFTPLSDFNIFWHLPQPPLSYCTSPNRHEDLETQQMQYCGATVVVFRDL